MSIFLHDEVLDVDLGYANLRSRNRPEASEIADQLEAMWQIYEPFADIDFRGGFAQDPEARFWEMHLGCALLAGGKTLLRREERAPSGGQPDLCVIDGNRRIWIEAIAPTEGAPGPDQVHVPVPQNQCSMSGAIPIRQAQLRITSALWTKSRAIERYLLEGTIDTEDVRLVAIGGGRFGVMIPEDPLPLILSSVFPIGQRFVSFDLLGDSVTEGGFHPSFHIERQTGQVSRTAFIEPQFSHLSGAIWSRVSIGNMSRKIRPLTLVHNPLAHVPMQQRWGVWDREYLTQETRDVWETTDILASNE